MDVVLPCILLAPLGLAQPNHDPTSLTPTEGQDLTFSTNLILEPQPHPDVDIEREEEDDVRDRPLRRILQLLGLQPCRPTQMHEGFVSECVLMMEVVLLLGVCFATVRVSSFTCTQTSTTPAPQERPASWRRILV